MSAPREAVALLGLGANIGDPRAQLAEAVRQLGMIVQITDLSSVYLTEPVGGVDQPPFLNMVCRITSALRPQALLALCHAVEQEMGRERGGKNGPRIIDIDLLAYDDLVISTEELMLPHPRMHERGFVLGPLREIAPEWRHPATSLTAAEMLELAMPVERVELSGRLEP